MFDDSEQSPPSDANAELQASNIAAATQATMKGSDLIHSYLESIREHTAKTADNTSEMTKQQNTTNLILIDAFSETVDLNRNLKNRLSPSTGAVPKGSEEE